MTAPGTNVAGLFVLNPLLNAPFPPIGYGSHDDLFADRHWKVFYVLARKVITLMTAFVSLGLGAVSYEAFFAEPKGLLRQTPLAACIFHREVFTAGQLAFIDTHKPFFEFFVVVSCGIIYGTHATV